MEPCALAWDLAVFKIEEEGGEAKWTFATKEEARAFRNRMAVAKARSKRANTKRDKPATSWDKPGPMWGKSDWDGYGLELRGLVVRVRPTGELIPQMDEEKKDV